MQDHEKLGVFYLGRQFDLSTKKSHDEQLILYDSKDLVTHAVCVGMTGSGKTGLCIALLEEAAIDGIPAIVIDPKGDLADLLLTFPELRPEDFRPWINEDDARRKGVDPDAFAKAQSELWKNGLAKWGQDGGRIARLKESADFAIYTPGSNAGLPVSILKSFAAPDDAIRSDNELFQDRIRTTAISLLGLLGIDADPLQSREHILLSNILATAWKDGKDLDLAALIQQIQAPPVQRIGVLEIESFFPQKERFALAMRMNNLLAAPGFENWLSGDPLDVGALLHTGAGKPRIAIFSIAHLSDAERMFFVSLLLNQMLGWVRTQSGTTSLRALLYMDEIFGYFPPTANPPSKQPLLTLMKQARAFGVGIVLATQNPVDLDYKGLSNAGTWLIGRLQTDRDKQRVLDGLEGAAAGASAKFDRGKMEQILAGLGNRVFLMNNVHEDEPVVLETRWVMSYLAGPLTRNQIKQLMDAKRGSANAGRNAPETSAPIATSATPAAAPAAVSRSAARPVLAPEIPQYFLPIRSAQPTGASLVYAPMLLGTATVYFNDPRSGVDVQQPLVYTAAFADGPMTVDWSRAAQLDIAESDLEKSPSQPDAAYGPLPADAGKAKSYDGWRRAFADAMYRISKLQLFRSPALEQLSKPGETERDFRVRLTQVAREQRDAACEKLRQKYEPKHRTLEDRIRRAEAAKQVQQEQASASKWQTAISVGATVLGAFLGRKTISAGNIGKATTAARGATRTYKESQDVTRADENVQALQQQLADLDAQFKAECDAIASKIDPTTESLETIKVRPKKTDITVRVLALAWAPYWHTSAGETTPAWE